LKETNNNSGNEDHHPTIIETESKEIQESKPPNDKIVYFNLLETNTKKKSI